MSVKLLGAAQGLPWIASLKTSKDDEHSDRINHRYTVGFLLVCASVALGAPFVSNRITCWVPAQFVGAYTTYTNNYCWISNTYYIPNNLTIPDDKMERRHAEIGYYQWSPFIFLTFALFFYLPRMLWRAMNTRSGIDIQHLLSKDAEIIIKDRDSKEKIIKAMIESLQDYLVTNSVDSGPFTKCCRVLSCTSGKRLGNYLRSIYIIVKLLYLINSFFQLVLIHHILGQPGWFYGITVWHKVFIQNSVLTDSPYFPRVTLCDLRIREVGNLHRYTVQCVLPVNMLNEKLFALTWFWFVYAFIANIFSFITLLNRTRPSYQTDFIRDLCKIHNSKLDADSSLLEDFTERYLMQDGVLILEIIYQNGSGFTAADVAHGLFARYKNNNNKKKHTINSKIPYISSSDV